MRNAAASKLSSAIQPSQGWARLNRSSSRFCPFDDVMVPEASLNIVAAAPQSTSL
jgi:hypothetical protein